MRIRLTACDKLPTVLTMALFFLALPAVAAAQGKIAFSTDRDGNSQIYAMNPDGSNQINLSNNAGNDYEPSFNENGGKIAFSSTRNGDLEIYRMNSDGLNQVVAHNRVSA